jgi:catechol 2,3-dioxygenase-like lactoylglutathione lyase family enzyme
MKQFLGRIALVVYDYDEAIAFYTRKLHFNLIEDTVLTTTKRWVVIAPPGSPKDGCCILLAKATDDEQRSRVGNQAGNRVFLFLFTDSFDRDFQNLIDQQITIVRQPIKEPYGRIAVFSDLYGNLWDLISAAE